MGEIPALAAHLAPNTIRQLERAASERFEEAERLRKQNRLLAAIYLYGYCVEMCLAAACFRRAGFAPNRVIDEDVRRRRMAQARQLVHQDGSPLMSSEPHPLDGWARYLQWHRCRAGTPAPAEEKRLAEAVHKAKLVYKHWRPELRYKTTGVSPGQLDEVQRCVRWFLEQVGRL